MRIGLDARFAGVHERGIGRYTFELIQGLIKEGLSNNATLVLFVNKKNAHLFLNMNNVEVIITEIPWYGFKEQIRLPEIIKKANVDFMHFPHYNVPITYRGAYIVTIHDLLLHRYPTSTASTKNWLYFYIKYLAYKVVIRSALTNASQIIAVSKFTKNEITHYYPKLKTPISVIYEGVSQHIKNNNQHIPRVLPQEYVISVGSAYPHKNLEWTIQTIIPFLRKHNLLYVFVGREDYFYTRLKTFTKKHHYDDVVRFFGEVNDGQLYTLLTGAGALLFLSKYEGFGLPAIEAMAVGCPVIVLESSALPEIVDEAGTIIKEETIAIEEALARILYTSSIRQHLINKGRVRAAMFTWGKMAKETKILYNMFTK